MKTLCIILMLPVAAFAGWQWTNDVGNVQWSPSKPIGGWVDGSLHESAGLAPRANPAFTRYWWLYSIAQRYGKTLPCDVTDLRAAMQSALAAAGDWQTAAGINADATDAANAFLLNGGASADWSVVPPEFIQ